MLGPGKLDISKWVPKSTALGPPGRPDKRRAHTEHTQSTHRAHTEHTQSPGEATEPERAEVQTHLWSRASTFYALPVPLPRQVSKIVKMGVWKWGQKQCWKSGSKGSPNGPQKLSKIDRKRAQEGSQKGTWKRYPLQDQEKWDFAVICYTLARSEVSKKSLFWGPF